MEIQKPFPESLKWVTRAGWVIRGASGPPDHLEPILHLTAEMTPVGFFIMVSPHQEQCPPG